MTSWVYFIQRDLAGPIKIGTAVDPDHRLDSLQIGCPDKLYLRAIQRGGLALEQELHTRFAEGRIRGEWFQPDTPGLGAAISDARHQEFWPTDEDGDEILLCARCEVEPVPMGRRKFCKGCAR